MIWMHKASDAVYEPGWREMDIGRMLEIRDRGIILEVRFY